MNRIAASQEGAEWRLFAQVISVGASTVPILIPADIIERTIRGLAQRTS